MAINGIDIIQIKLVIAVNDIDNDTSPLDKEVNIFDVAPPGTAAITITPIASSGDIFGNIKIIIEKAIMGKIMIWENKPIKISFGWINILVKSDTLKFKPKENIINAIAKGNKAVNSIIYNNIWF